MTTSKNIRNTPRRCDTLDRYCALATAMWFNFHRERWNAPEQSAEEINRLHGFKNGQGLTGLSDLCKNSESIPTRAQIQQLLDRAKSRARERKTAALRSNQPTPEERAQMDALLAKYPNLIQRNRTTPTLF